NIMQSPKTWIAYVNKNQIKWQDDLFDFEKAVDSVITFTAPIVNSGGALKAFTIDGLPNWMTADITSGTIAPNSVQNIVFTIPAGGSIGEYSADVSVNTDFNYAEILQVNLKVKGVVPTWTVNPSDFQYSMNIFGQMKIDHVIATNPENKIAAFSNGVICGVANLQYLPAYDRYEVFLNVYSNNVTGDSIKFNIYDAASGLTFVKVTPSLMFVENYIAGTVSNPITFFANTEIKLNIPLNLGWTWFSLPLKSSNLRTGNLLMSSVSSTTGDVVISNSDYDQFDSGLGWLGNISQSAGFFNNQSYKMKKTNLDTLIHIGERINPDSLIAKINVQPGWNWIGYVSTKNVAVNEALGNYNAVTGDLIKSQYEFAYYDNLIGWTGNLTYMKPTMGYMLKSTSTSSFNYPQSSYLGRYSGTNDENLHGQKVAQNIFPFSPEKFDNTMSAIFTGNVCNDALDRGNVLLGAFDRSHQLRGYAYPIKNTSNNTYNFYLTTYSNLDGEELNLKYINSIDGSVAPTNHVMTFTTNALLGLPNSPVIANVADSIACNFVYETTAINNLGNTINSNVFPNPFTNNLNLSFSNSVSCNVELIDVLGKIVYSSTIKNKKDFVLNLEETKSSIAVGMYYIRLTGDINKQIKVVKTK
ncbi:MAG: T9SS type A sorting domain-containing protein, partial [Flavobacterium sp.]|nr:T9SS type A sorting domain-containing protein [Flavobacterium sp.]